MRRIGLSLSLAPALLLASACGPSNIPTPDDPTPDRVFVVNADGKVMGRPIAQFFDCGSTLTGPMVDAGRVTAVVVTTLSPLPDGTTSASTRVTGTLRRNDGASGDPIVCSSTGAIEEHLRTATEKRLASAP